MNKLIHNNINKNFLIHKILSSLDNLSISKLICTTLYHTSVVVLYDILRIIIAQYGHGLNFESLV